MNKKIQLDNIDFGGYIAEQENSLSSYFQRTAVWESLKSGDADIIIGAKGSGKSALFRELLGQKESSDNIIILSAENVNDSPVFETVLKEAEPLNEYEFKGLWGIYLAAVIGNHLIANDEYKVYKDFLDILLKEKLIKKEESSLSAMLKTAKKYVKALFERGAEIGLSTEINGVKHSGNIVFESVTIEEESHGYIYINDLLKMVDKMLKKQEKSLWVCFDRLDVAFEKNEDIEVVALRTLLKFYLNTIGLTNIKLKIFLRKDIFSKITNKERFSELTHLQRKDDIVWNNEDILNMIVLRMVSKEEFIKNLSHTRDQILADSQLQSDLFYSVFPAKVDGKENVNDKKSPTLNWLVNRTVDSTDEINPRDILYLLNRAKKIQMNLDTRGERSDSTISKKALKQALKDTSKFKLEQFFYAEYPNLTSSIKKLKGLKSEQSIDTLKEIWGKNEEDTVKIVNDLVRYGFFSEKQDKKYVVPFIYRFALDIKQGSQNK